MVWTLRTWIWIRIRICWSPSLHRGFGCHNAYGAPVPCAGRKKREAEAEADPFLYYPAYPGVTSVGGLTTYSNGAVVPTDLNNQAATAAHLLSTYPRPHGYGVYGLGLWG